MESVSRLSYRDAIKYIANSNFCLVASGHEYLRSVTKRLSFVFLQFAQEQEFFRQTAAMSKREKEKVGSHGYCTWVHYFRGLYIAISPKLEIRVSI